MQILSLNYVARIRFVMILLFATICLLCFKTTGHAFDKDLVLYLPFEEGEGDIGNILDEIDDTKNVKNKVVNRDANPL